MKSRSMVSIGGTQDKLTGIADDSTEVRAAALYALGTFMGASGSADPNKQGGEGTGRMFQLEERLAVWSRNGEGIL